MQQIYGSVTKIMIESRQGSNLLYLPLDKIMQQVSQGGAAAPEGAASTGAAGAASPAAAGTAASDARARDSRNRERESR
jgi:membrane protease subunit HflK